MARVGIARLSLIIGVATTSIGDIAPNATSASCPRDTFIGKPVAACPSKRADTSANNVHMANAKLRAELAKLKADVGTAPAAPTEGDAELAKLVTDAKAVGALAKTMPYLAEALATMEARTAARGPTACRTWFGAPAPVRERSQAQVI